MQVETAPHSEPEQRVVFSQSVEGLIRTLGTVVPEQARQAFLAEGVDLGKPLQSAYAFEQYIRLVEWTTHFRFKDLPDDEAFFRQGRDWFRSYGQTFMGKALLTMMRVLGPRRVMLRATHNFRYGNNYTTVDVHERAPNDFEVEITPVRHPGLHRGIFTGGLEASGAKDIEVALLERVGERVRFRVRWA